MDNQKKYKLITLLGVVNFPQMPISCDIRRESSKASIIEAYNRAEQLIFVTQTKPYLSDDVISSINNVGCLSSILGVDEHDGVLQVQAEGTKRMSIQSVVKENDSLFCYATELQSVANNPEKVSVLLNSAKEHFVEYTSYDKRITPEILRLVDSLNDADSFVDAVTTIAVRDEKKQLSILNQVVVDDRLELLIGYLLEQIEIAKVNVELSNKVHKSMDKNQKEYYLREQMKAISEELGDEVSEFDEIEQKIKNGKMPEEVKTKALKELNRVKKLPNASPDYSVLRNYLDVLLELPWGIKTVDNKDLVRARQILDEDHSGLDKVKDRIIEYLAVMHLTDKIGGQIICFVGPPGVGKTSIAKSIARALDRKFVKMSVGGVKDESEIRGHRKTYVGAMPGRIIYNMGLAGSTNPVFLIDEIDKMSSDFRGDPTSAMLEVLDPEQNSVFRDNFLEVPFDLSNVLFIATANNISDIPTPLLDRMEVIELSSYTLNEKFDIAKKHLIPKLLEAHGITENDIKIEDEALKEIIDKYTYEAGVRGLERTLASVCRKVAVKAVNDKEKVLYVVTKNNLYDYLGAHKVIVEGKREYPEVGVVSGLAYTTVGGGVLTIEVNLVLGDGKIVMTGRLGDVMQESAKVALSAVMGKAQQFGIDPEIFHKRDLHIHVPEGAVKKDGPSAGCALATAIYSVFAGKKIDNDLAMTGEITIRGNVLAIGGLKEKLFACVRAGISKVIVPEQNREDVKDLPQDITSHLNITYAKTLDDVLQKAMI
ncbi:MAG TPA: endopeptidase La [Clostridiales bacterium]|nr:endopeptidase La [Clostridiales bacterium]